MYFTIGDYFRKLSYLFHLGMEYDHRYFNLPNPNTRTQLLCGSSKYMCIKCVYLGVIHIHERSYNT